MQARLEQLKRHHVRVGWVDGAKEQERARPNEKAKAMNKARKKAKLKGKGEIVSNFDVNTVGPGIRAASLAEIAKTLNYGRAGGISKKDGHEYGAIPARNFVEVFRNKHMKPVTRTVVREVLDFDNPSPDVNLKKVGVIAKGQLQRAMKDSNEYAPNAPFTINGGWMANPKNGKPFYSDGKKSARPLIDTGTLINSVDFEIK